MVTRTRFAPSPTGFMHIGGVRTALFAYLIAKQNDGQFILRIEDTDQERFVEGATEVIYATLKDLGLFWDEGPDVGGPVGSYIQSERKNSYMEYANRLMDEGKAYRCFCSEEELAKEKEIAESKGVPYKYGGRCKKLTGKQVEDKLNNNEPFVVRFNMPKDEKATFDDIVYGKVIVESNELEDFILIKSDKMPTYNFANIIDDTEMKISHIVRGNEYVSSTPKYVKVYEALGFAVPEFVHLPIIKETADSDKKLSKRNKAATVASLKGEGYLNEAIINMLALTGWSPKDNNEFFTLEDLLRDFDIKRIGKGNAIFDTEKLKFFNAHYIKLLDEKKYLEFIKPFLEEGYDLSDKSKEWIDHLLLIYKDHISYGKEIVEVTDLFFKTPVMNEECREFMGSDESISMTLRTFKEEIENIKDWSIENISLAINNVKEKTGVKGKLLYMPIRIAVSSQMHGPELPDTIYLLGKEMVLNRLK